MIFKLFSAGALMFLGVACTSCEKENENNKESDIPMEQVSYKASNEIIVNPERGFYKATFGSVECIYVEKLSCEWIFFDIQVFLFEKF